MTASKPQNMKEALEIIEMLQAKNEKLQNRNDSLELLLHNMNEMLIVQVPSYTIGKGGRISIRQIQRLSANRRIRVIYPRLGSKAYRLLGALSENYHYQGKTE